MRRDGDSASVIMTDSEWQSKMEVRFRTVEFQTMLQSIDVPSSKILNLFEGKKLDNSINHLLDTTPLVRWAARTVPTENDSKRMFDLLIQSGAAVYINQPDSSGYRPIDRAYDWQIKLLLDTQNRC